MKYAIVCRETGKLLLTTESETVAALVTRSRYHAIPWHLWEAQAKEKPE